MKQELNSRLEALPGRIGLYYENLTTGETWSFRGEELYESASVIKLPVYAAVMRLADQGKVDLREELFCREEDKMPSCGALSLLEGERYVDMQSLCNLMIAISDNTATNLLLRRFGLDFLNEQFREIGLEKTHLERLLFDAEGSRRGLENRIVPTEIGGLLGRLARGEYVSPDVSERMIALLRRQQIKHKLQGYLPRGTVVAHKTGEDSGITNDVGVVFAGQPFVLCFASNGTDVPAAERCLRQLALDLYRLSEEEKPLGE
ncbi:MAG: serine hydrolase [Oscillospiraceae bacterium]|nr:serine hydrolase [Oscillospiraceae bacterium]